MDDDLVIYLCRPGCAKCTRQAKLAFAAAYLEVLTRP